MLVEDTALATSSCKQAKRHVDKVLDYQQATRALAKTGAKLSSRLNDVRKASMNEPQVHKNIYVVDVYNVDHTLENHAVMNLAIHGPRETPTLISPPVKSIFS